MKKQVSGNNRYSSQNKQSFEFDEENDEDAALDIADENNSVEDN